MPSSLRGMRDVRVMRFMRFMRVVRSARIALGLRMTPSLRNTHLPRFAAR